MNKVLLPWLIIFAASLTAQQPVQLAEDLTIIPISKKACIHVSTYSSETMNNMPANGLVFVDQGKAFIVDTPWTENQTSVLIHWITDSLGAEVEGVIPTHWHIDCMGGLAAVHNSDIESYAYQLTCEIAKSKGLPVPTHCFQDSLYLDGGKLICRFPGGGHTPDNIVVYLPEEKILFGGCMLKAMNWNSLGFTGDADLEAWPSTLKKVLDAYPDARIVIPGHGDAGGLNLVRHTLELFGGN